MKFRNLMFVIVFSCTIVSADQEGTKGNDYDDVAISSLGIPGALKAELILNNDMTFELFSQAITAVIDKYVEPANKKGGKLLLRAPGDPADPNTMHKDDLYEDVHGRKRVLERLWSISIPNAHATRLRNEPKWYITVYGGLAKQREITQEALVLVTCHEIGHYFGGFPLTLYNNIAGFWVEKLSSEAQADYYAGQVCARLVWEATQNEVDSRAVPYSSLIAEDAKIACDNGYEDSKQVSLCYKIIYAGLGSAALWHRMAGSQAAPPSTSSPDNTRVEMTMQEFYPPPQCRLDTYYRSALCPTNIESRKNDQGIPYDILSIPGLDHGDMPESVAARDASKELACGDQFPAGARPMCWFAEDYYSNCTYYEDAPGLAPPLCQF